MCEKCREGTGFSHTCLLQSPRASSTASAGSYFNSATTRIPVINGMVRGDEAFQFSGRHCLAHRAHVRPGALSQTVSSQSISYSQRFEDLYLLRCFLGQAVGFYVDIGSGHPVYDNVSFAFYLKGWSGIVAEPNPRLTALTRAVRPRDRIHEGVVGAASGDADFYLVHDFHGLSTGSATNAAAALAQFGRPSDKITVRSITLADLCADAAPGVIEFLKVDVEGAEADVLRSGDWTRFRPKVIVVEALAPFTLAPAWEAFEPFLIERGYHYVWFDSLNRYYVANEAQDLDRHFALGPIHERDVETFRDAGRALERPGHADHSLACLVATAAMARLPLLDPPLVIDLLTTDLNPADLAKRASKDEMQRICERVFGRPCTANELSHLTAPDGASVADCYAKLVDSDLFRAACGRISAGYAW